MSASATFPEIVQKISGFVQDCFWICFEQFLANIRFSINLGTPPWTTEILQQNVDETLKFHEQTLGILREMSRICPGTFPGYVPDVF